VTTGGREQTHPYHGREKCDGCIGAAAIGGSDVAVELDVRGQDGSHQERGEVERDKGERIERSPPARSGLDGGMELELRLRPQLAGAARVDRHEHITADVPDRMAGT